MKSHTCSHTLEEDLANLNAEHVNVLVSNDTRAHLSSVCSDEYRPERTGDGASATRRVGNGARQIQVIVRPLSSFFLPSLTD